MKVYTFGVTKKVVICIEAETYMAAVNIANFNLSEGASDDGYDQVFNEAVPELTLTHVAITNEQAS